MKKRISALVAVILFAAVITVVAGAVGQRTGEEGDSTSGDKWEYLVVAGSTSNFTPSGNPTHRKEPSPFSREAFVLEQNLDKLGTKGWELVTVSGPPSDPIFFFKRRK